MVIVPISQIRNLKLTQPGVGSRNLSEVHLSLKPQVFPADYWSCQRPQGKPVPLQVAQTKASAYNVGDLVQSLG